MWCCVVRGRGGPYLQFLLDLLAPQVQIRLFRGELMQVPLTTPVIPRPGRPPVHAQLREKFTFVNRNAASTQNTANASDKMVLLTQLLGGLEPLPSAQT